MNYSKATQPMKLTYKGSRLREY